MERSYKSSYKVILDKKTNTIQLKPSKYEKFIQKHPTAHKRTYVAMNSIVSTTFIIGMTSLSQSLLNKGINSLEGRTLETYQYPLFASLFVVPAGALVGSLKASFPIAEKILRKVEPKDAKEAKAYSAGVTLLASVGYAAYLLYDAIRIK